MQSHDRTESAPLEPPQEQLSEFLVVRVATMEAANVGRPPRYASHTCIQTSHELTSKHTPGRCNVATPHQCSISLRASPCTTQQIDDVSLSSFRHTFVERLSIALWVHIPNLQIRSQMIPVNIKVIDIILRLSLIKPKQLDAFGVIILLSHLPHILASIRICGVVVHSLAFDVHGGSDATICADEEAFLEHVRVVGAALVDGGPD